MSFGPIMELPAGELRLRMAPLSRSDMTEYVRDGGMQLHSVTHLLHLSAAPTQEDEEEWYDKTRKDMSSLVWGIWDATPQDAPVLIGSTSLNSIVSEPFKQAVSGIVLFRPEYWGRGVASSAHKARTWYAFTQMGLHRIKSATVLENEGSYKALQRSGYTEVSIERNFQYCDGKYMHLRNLECLNPLDRFWSAWWGLDQPPAANLVARERTRAAMEWAQQHVKLL